MKTKKGKGATPIKPIKKLRKVVVYMLSRKINKLRKEGKA